MYISCCLQLLMLFQDSWAVGYFASPELASQALQTTVIWSNKSRSTIRHHYMTSSTPHMAHYNHFSSCNRHPPSYQRFTII